ncbi:MAG: HTTM domain-containing protein [Thermodesulfobacteriota bacterium]
MKTEKYSSILAKSKAVYQTLTRGFMDNIILWEGSTRPIALIRIGIVFLLWARFASELLPFSKPTLFLVITGLSFFLSTLLMLLGFWTQFATAWTGANLVWLYLVAGPILIVGTGFKHHHTYLLVAITCLLALTPCGRSYSLDRVLALWKAKKQNLPLPLEIGPLWATLLIGLQVSMVYFWGAFDKTNWGFLSGSRMEHLYILYYSGSSDYPRFPGFSFLMFVLATATVVLEYVLAIFLWIERFQKWLIPLAIGFQLVIYYTLPVSTFSLTMCLLFLIYIDPDKAHRFIDELQGITLKET